MKNIVIKSFNVETDCQKFSEMWYASKDGWFEDMFEGERFTPKGVREAHEKNNSIKKDVAWLGDRIVGCCELYDFYLEKNVCYIGLINARDDVRGKGVGKRLIIDAVNFAIDKNYERIDLNTWASNINAVPLYKKSGFFWVPRSNGVHMVNMIPQIMNNEFCRDYFKKNDWYETLDREIKVEMDDDKIGETPVFIYNWKSKDGQEKLEVIIDADSKKIIGIDNGDESFSILHKNTPKKYMDNEFSLTLKNYVKTKKKFTLRSLDDDSLITKEVESEESFSCSYQLDPDLIPVEEHRTQTAKYYELSVRGRKTILAPNTKFKKPFSVSLGLSQSTFIRSIEKEIVLNIISNLEEEVELELEVAGVASKLNLEPKKSYGQKFRLKYDEEGSFPLKAGLKFKIKEEEYHYQEMDNIISVFDYPGVYQSESISEYFIDNEHFRIIAQKESNEIKVRDKYGKGIYFNLGTPAIGKPFSNEMSRLRPETQVACNKNGLTLTRINKSLDFPGTVVKTLFEVNSSPWMKVKVYLENVDQRVTHIRQGSYSQNDGGQTIIPLKTGILRSTYPENIAEEKIYGSGSDIFQERWMANEVDNYVFGIIFEELEEANFNNWQFLSGVSNLTGRDIKEDEAVSRSQYYFGPGNHEIIRERYKRYHTSDVKLSYEKIHDDYLRVSQPNIFHDKNEKKLLVELENHRKCGAIGKLTDVDGIFIKEPIEFEDFRGKKEIALDMVSNENRLKRMKLNHENTHRHIDLPCNLISYDSSKQVDYKENGSMVTINNQFFTFSVDAKRSAALQDFIVNGSEMNVLTENPDMHPTCFMNPCLGGVQPAVSINGKKIIDKIDFEVIRVKKGAWEGVKLVSDGNLEVRNVVTEIEYLTMPDSNILEINLTLSSKDNALLDKYFWETKVYIHENFEESNQFAVCYGKDLEINKMGKTEKVIDSNDCFYSHISKKRILSVMTKEDGNNSSYIIHDSGNRQLKSALFGAYSYNNPVTEKCLKVWLVVDDQFDHHELLERVKFHKHIQENM